MRVLGARALGRVPQRNPESEGDWDWNWRAAVTGEGFSHSSGPSDVLSVHFCERHAEAALRHSVCGCVAFPAPFVDNIVLHDLGIPKLAVFEFISRFSVLCH